MEFIYEKLDVWKAAVEFGIKTMKLAADKSDDSNLQSVLQVLEKSAMNVSMAIAKGKGYPSKHDFAKHLYLARGSVYETMTLLEILKRKQAISDDQYTEFGESGDKVAAMLGGLLKAMYKPSDSKKNQRNSGDR
jgi:four helix bundle protein